MILRVLKVTRSTRLTETTGAKLSVPALGMRNATEAEAEAEAENLSAPPHPRDSKPGLRGMGSADQQCRVEPFAVLSRGNPPRASNRGLSPPLPDYRVRPRLLLGGLVIDCA